MKLNITLDEELTRRYETVKEHTDLNNDKSVLAFLISKEYNRIQRAKYHRLFLPKETYDLAEEAARARGQTIDEYVDELTEAMLKEAKEGVKHGN
jgi:hypothetical protein